MALTKVPSNLDSVTATTQSASDNSTNVATTAYVTTAIANLVDGAPSTLNTLDEIAAALNDDAALNTTLTNSIATKLPLAGGTMTGALNMGSQNITNANRITLADGVVDSGQAGSSTVFNNDGTTADFRIESSGNANMFFLDGGTNKIGIGTASPDSELQIMNNDSSSYRFGYGGTSDVYLDADNVYFRTDNGGANTAIISTSGVGIGTTSPSSKLHIEDASSPVVLVRDTTNNCTLQMYAQNSNAHIGTSSNHSLFFDTNNTQRVELTTAGVLNCGNDVAAFGTLSDITLKENIQVIENPLDKVKQIRGVNFSYKKDGRKSTGLIAQELEKVLPNAIFTTHEIGDDKEIKAIRYGNVVGLLVEAIKEQQEQIEELKAKLEEVA